MSDTFSSSFEFKFSCIVVFIVPLWAPLSCWILNIDAGGRIPLLLMLLAFILLGIRIRRVSLKKPMTIYVLLAFYILINGFIHKSYLNYEGNGVYLLVVNVMKTVLYMLVVSCIAYYDFDKTTKWIARSLLLYCVLCLLFGQVTDDERLGGELNSNNMAVYADFSFFCMLLQYLRGKRSLISLLLFSIIPVVLIVMTGSRTGFLLLVVMAFISVLLLYRKGHAASIFLVAVTAVVLVVGSFYVMNNTILGDRLQDTTTQIKGGETETNTILDNFGDRGPQYYWSWPYFLEHPLFGIGLGNWRMVSGSPYVFHSEWLVLYVENGLVAIITYLLFYFSLLREAWSKTRQLYDSDKRTMQVLLFSLVSVFLLNFVSWTYNNFCVFAFYAMVYAFAKQKKEKRFSRRIK